MKAIAALLLLAVACTHNRPFSAINEVEGRVIVRTSDGQAQNATIISTPNGKVLQSDSGAFIDIGNVVTLTDERSLRGALEGFGIGGGIGFGVGAIIGIADGDDDEPCSDHGLCLNFTRGEKAIILGVVFGGLGAFIGLAAGAIRGSQFVYEGGEVPVVRPGGPPGSLVGVTVDFGFARRLVAERSIDPVHPTLRRSISMPDRHGRVDSTLAVLDTCVRAGDRDGALEQLLAFDADLARYARGEEQLLFPVIDRFTSVPPRATAVMRTEHRSLRRLVDTLGELLARDDAPRALDVLGSLRSVLFLHLEKEAWVLAPVMR